MSLRCFISVHESMIFIWDWKFVFSNRIITCQVNLTVYVGWEINDSSIKKKFQLSTRLVSSCALVP